jgi:predicted enzyme related to lactoylglutathione lyase
MRLENIVWGARDPHRLGNFWAAAVGAEVTADDAEGVEARLTLTGAGTGTATATGDGAFLDLCFQSVDRPSAAPPRLHPDLAGGQQQADVVQRLLALGARHADIGQGDVPWAVLADPEGNAFCVMQDRDVYVNTGPIAALALDSADPERDAEFWAAITGWHRVDDDDGLVTLRHPAGVGPLLELFPEPEPHRGPGTIHLDVRPSHDDPDPVSLIRRLGGRTLVWPGAEGRPWTVCADPSGNEFCVLSPVGAT